MEPRAGPRADGSPVRMPLSLCVSEDLLSEQEHSADLAAKISDPCLLHSLCSRHPPHCPLRPTMA